LSSDTETTCKYEGCRRKVARDGKCIFHLADKNLSEAEEFNSRLPVEIEKMQKDATLDMIDLSGFRFPRPTYKFPSETRFEKAIDFRQAVFEGRVDFSRCEFLDFASFERAKFLEDASFNNAKFSFLALFMGAKFSGRAYFDQAEFSGWGIFFATEFSGDASFLYAKFSDWMNFEGAKFLGAANFLNSQFLDDASFDRSQFSGDTSFCRSKVSSLVTFRATIFQTANDQILSSPIKPYTHFEEIRVDNRGEVRFEGGVCMSRVSLHYADIRRFSFFDVKWGRLGGRASVMEHGILEERKRRSKDAETILPDITPEHVHQIYVRLRRNLERGAGRYPEAGDFFINEKEMRKLILQEGHRWPPTGNFLEWLILKVYGWLALYGESLARPVAWSMVTVVVFALLKMVASNLQAIDFSFNLQMILKLTKLFPDFLMKSMMAFFQMRSEPGLDILERLVSIPILGSLFIALKRKFERR